MGGDAFSNINTSEVSFLEGGGMIIERKKQVPRIVVRWAEVVWIDPRFL